MNKRGGKRPGAGRKPAGTIKKNYNVRPETKASALKVSAVSGGWNHGFAVDVQYEGDEWKRVKLDRDILVKDDGSYDLDYVSKQVDDQAPQAD